jgi:hypothetical protein
MHVNEGTRVAFKEHGYKRADEELNENNL